jgi:hypothetical protein
MSSQARPRDGAVVVHVPANDNRSINLEEVSQSDEETPAHDRLRHIMPALPHAFRDARYAKLRGR